MHRKTNDLAKHYWSDFCTHSLTHSLIQLYIKNKGIPLNFFVEIRILPVIVGSLIMYPTWEGRFILDIHPGRVCPTLGSRIDKCMMVKKKGGYAVA